jgi:hypothetical protein
MPNPVYDFIGSFKDGMNSGIDPLLLPKTQLAFASNGTLRGDFFQTRPATQQLDLAYVAPSVQTDFQTGLFQGAAYYKPDAGPEALALQIGGCQFLATPDSSGNALVQEITIPGDPDSAAQPQAWICQAENFLIFNDGLDLPVFYDGATSRRSLGASQPLGTVNAATSAPAIGSTTALQLLADYTGPLNQPIFIGTAIYVVTAVGGSGVAYSVELQTLYDPDTSHPAGTPLYRKTAQIGEAQAVFNPIIPNQPVGVVTFELVGTTIPTNVGVGDSITLSNPTVPPSDPSLQTIKTNVFAINKPSRTRMALVFFSSAARTAATTGLWLASLTGGGAVTQQGTVAVGFSVQTSGTDITVDLASNFKGYVGQIIWIGNGQYQIVSITNLAPIPDLNITVENITDTLGTKLLNLPLTTLPELPAGRSLCYGQGRVWESMIDGLSFLGGDIVNGTSGSPGYNYRDAVLRVTENDSIAGGGLFRVPGSAGDIKAMQFCALLDASLGQGPLQIFTPNCVFSCQAPVDRSTWAALTNPILTQSLIGAGGVAQNSVSLANGDILFRSSDSQIRSLLMARLDFNRWSNTPVSREMARVLDQEDSTLLAYSTSAVFDNRFLMGAGLTSSNRGVFSPSLIALNFDPVSSLRGADTTIYDGQWSGLNVLQLVSGFFSGVSRCFAVCLSTDLTQIEIHEILPSSGPASLTLDDGVTAITAAFESPVLDFGDRRSGARTYKRLQYGEIFVDNITGPVTFQAFYKPDQWPNWVPWYSWTQSYSQPSTLNPQLPSDPGFRPRVGLPMPDGTVFDTVNNRPLREGFTFQFQLVATGSFRFLGARFSADLIPQPEFAVPVSP